MTKRITIEFYYEPLPFDETDEEIVEWLKAGMEAFDYYNLSKLEIKIVDL